MIPPVPNQAPRPLAVVHVTDGGQIEDVYQFATPELAERFVAAVEGAKRAARGGIKGVYLNDDGRDIDHVTVQVYDEVPPVATVYTATIPALNSNLGATLFIGATIVLPHDTCGTPGVTGLHVSGTPEHGYRISGTDLDEVRAERDRLQAQVDILRTLAHQA